MNQGEIIYQILMDEGFATVSAMRIRDKILKETMMEAMHNSYHDLLKVLTGAMDIIWEGTCDYCKEEEKQCKLNWTGNCIIHLHHDKSPRTTCVCSKYVELLHEEIHNWMEQIYHNNIELIPRTKYRTFDDYKNKFCKICTEDDSS